MWRNKVVCVNTQNGYNHTQEGQPFLVIGKTYEVMREFLITGHYHIIDDEGHNGYFIKSQFIELREYNLEKLGI